MPKDAVDTRKLKDSVAEYLKKSKFDKAAELLEELAEAEPKDMQHRLRLGDCYRRLGETVKSILNYDAAARRFADEGHLIKAIAAVKVILEIDPDNRDSQQQLAEMNERRLGKPDTGPVARAGQDEAKSSPAGEGEPKGKSGAQAIEAIELPEEPPATAPDRARSRRRRSARARRRSQDHHRRNRTDPRLGVARTGTDRKDRPGADPGSTR
jgi:tetratricopeptide (TPR) repeat protein